MRDIPLEQVIQRLRVENPWWIEPHAIDARDAELRPRVYLEPFLRLVEESRIRRAVLLLGPRRVGKTVLLGHTIQRILARGVTPTSICYISVDHPLYNGRSLTELLDFYRQATGRQGLRGAYVFFDEIQYLREWEHHLKALVDTHRDARFVASGSAAAALRLKSQESGAGRFTDFLLPPLTFHEYLSLLGTGHLVVRDDRTGEFSVPDIEALNAAFIAYMNFGGYPEVALSPVVQADAARFVKADIIDKVLLRDLPSLYGIQDIQELNSLFTALAYNTAGEVSLEALSRRSGVVKNTLKRYVEYLEAAFLIRIVHRVDRDGRRFQRAHAFKVYLTNPSMRAALFAPVTGDDEATGVLAETAVCSQWFHTATRMHYARWSGHEVDIVLPDANGRPLRAIEVKWSDRYVERPEELTGLLAFCRANRLARAVATTRTRLVRRAVGSLTVEFVPASLYCYLAGLSTTPTDEARPKWSDSHGR